MKYLEQSYEFRLQKKVKETRLIFYLKWFCLAVDEDGEREEVFDRIDRIDTIRGEDTDLFQPPLTAG